MEHWIAGIRASVPSHHGTFSTPTPVNVNYRACVSHYAGKDMERCIPDVIRISALLQLCCDCQNVLRRIVGARQGADILKFERIETIIGQGTKYLGAVL